MRLLVTGGAGFIGARFVRYWLATHPRDRVVTLDALTYAGSRERLSRLPGSARHRFVRGDLLDAALVRRVLNGADAVVHLAAETHVDRSITDGGPFLRTNVEGTYALARAVREAGVRRLLHVSTDEVYGPVLRGTVDELAPLRPRSPYAASKAAGDLLVQACRETFGLPVVIARPTNVYGPAQFPEKFIPVCITHALLDRPVPIYGDGRQRRGWLYVDDLCAALARLLERGRVGEIYNIGSGAEQANRDTARQVLARLGKPASLLRRVADRPGHDRRYALNDAKLRALGWRAATPFHRGLDATITWYGEHEAWWRPLVQRLRDDPYHWLHRPARSGAVRAPGAHR